MTKSARVSPSGGNKHLKNPRLGRSLLPRFSSTNPRRSGRDKPRQILIVPVKRPAERPAPCPRASTYPPRAASYPGTGIFGLTIRAHFPAAATQRPRWPRPRADTSATPSRSPIGAGDRANRCISGDEFDFSERWPRSPRAPRCRPLTLPLIEMLLPFLAVQIDKLGAEIHPVYEDNWTSGANRRLSSSLVRALRSLCQLLASCIRLGLYFGQRWRSTNVPSKHEES